MKKISPTGWILLCMVAGIVVGYFIHSNVTEEKEITTIANQFSIISEVFLTLIKMIIAPLVFSTLVVGIAHMGDAAAIGRVFFKALAWFFSASLLSLVLGLILANVMQPGSQLNFPIPDSHLSANLATNEFTFHDFIKHLIPSSFVDAMAKNEILQIVVFSIFFGVAMASLGEKMKYLIKCIDELSHVMLKITTYVMKFAPVAVFAAMVSTVSTNGLGILADFAVFMLDFYIALICLWLVLILAGFLFLGPRIRLLLIQIKEAFLISFATASSEAAYPKILSALDRFGVNRKISSFVMPLGYSFNLDGSMMYCTFATLFIAQAYGMHIPIVTQITMLLVLMLTSKGMAGVPRASLVVIAATLNQFNIPEAGLLMILGVDTFLDMGRSATNAVGNSIASAVVAKWEGHLLSEEEARRQAIQLDLEASSKVKPLPEEV